MTETKELTTWPAITPSIRLTSRNAAQIRNQLVYIASFADDVVLLINPEHGKLYELLRSRCDTLGVRIVPSVTGAAALGLNSEEYGRRCGLDSVSRWSLYAAHFTRATESANNDALGLVHLEQPLKCLFDPSRFDIDFDRVRIAAGWFARSTDRAILYPTVQAVDQDDARRHAVLYRHIIDAMEGRVHVILPDLLQPIIADKPRVLSTAKHYCAILRDYVGADVPAYYDIRVSDSDKRFWDISQLPGVVSRVPPADQVLLYINAATIGDLPRIARVLAEAGYNRDEVIRS